MCRLSGAKGQLILLKEGAIAESQSLPFPIIHPLPLKQPPPSHNSGKRWCYPPLAFNHPPAGDHFCVAKVLLQKRKTPMWVSFFFGAGDEARLATGIPRMAEPFAGALPDLLIQRASRRSRQRVQTCPRHSKKKTPSARMVFSFWSGRRGSNSLPRPWQGRALPDELRPQTAPLLQRLWCLRPGSNRRHADFQSAALPTELPRQIGDQEGARTLDLQRDRLAF